jgi:hypothetical protein
MLFKKSIRSPVLPETGKGCDRLPQSSIFMGGGGGKYLVLIYLHEFLRFFLHFLQEHRFCLKFFLNPYFYACSSH